MHHAKHLDADQRTARTIIWIGIVVAALMVMSGNFTGRVGFESGSRAVGTVSNTIRADHYYNDAGAHVVEGWVMAPSECYVAHAGVRIAESYPEQVLLRVVLKKLPEEESCAQGATGIPFKVSFRASSEARIGATLNGRSVKFVLSDRRGSVVSPGTSFDLKVREERFVGSTKVRFDAVESDSRCPSDADVACIQAGEAKLVFTVGGKPVRLSFPGGKTSASIGSQVFSISKLRPAKYVGQAADTMQYQATVQLALPH